MGYTHYWSDEGEGDALPAEAVTLIQQITTEAYREGLIQREEGDPRPPIVKPREIRFNGVGEEGHDTFSFAPGEQSFGCCKTAYKPYDAVVMRILLVLAYYRPGLEIRSDGAFDEEWEPALNWFNTQVGGVCVVQQLSFYRPIGQGRFRFDHHA